MEVATKVMQNVGDDVLISRYEIMQAFFRTEEEDNLGMADALNSMLNDFCDSERETRNNVVSLPFNKKAYQNVIEYIQQSSFG